MELFFRICAIPKKRGSVTLTKTALVNCRALEYEEDEGCPQNMLPLVLRAAWLVGSSQSFDNPFIIEGNLL